MCLWGIASRVELLAVRMGLRKKSRYDHSSSDSLEQSRALRATCNLTWGKSNSVLGEDGAGDVREGYG